MHIITLFQFNSMLHTIYLIMLYLFFSPKEWDKIFMITLIIFSWLDGFWDLCLKRWPFKTRQSAAISAQVHLDWVSEWFCSVICHLDSPRTWNGLCCSFRLYSPPNWSGTCKKGTERAPTHKDWLRSEKGRTRARLASNLEPARFKDAVSFIIY